MTDDRKKEAGVPAVGHLSLFFSYLGKMIEEFKEGYVKVDHAHGVATIEFFHPKK